VHVVATAGHVDHGKSTLVLALTGTDPDRWPEEKDRGLTIDLGFAHLELPSGREVALVDVPGHVRFLRNMLAGVGAVDAALMVVAAPDGWKPQSEEHLRILELLGVAHGVVVLTKVAGLDADTRALARMDLDEHLAGSALAGAEVVEVDSLAGWGLDDLRAALDRLVAATPTATDRGRPRLWVDRCFVSRGSGTVVTGTLAGGYLQEGEEVEIIGPGPAGRRRARARVRALQTHGHSRPRVGPGHRVAVNLGGVNHGDVTRGDALVQPGRWHVTRTVDASLGVLGGLDHPVSRRGAYHLYVGSGEYPVRLRILGPEAVEPGEEGCCRLHLPVGLALLPGDRYVLRESGRSETVGGGSVLDVDPVLPAARARPSPAVDRVVAERGWVDVDHLQRLTGEYRRPDVGGRWVVDPEMLEASRAALVSEVAAAGPYGLDLAVLDERRRGLVEGLPGVEVRGGRLVAAGTVPAVTAAGRAWAADLAARPWEAPGPAAAGVERETLRELVRSGAVVERDGAWFAAETVDRTARTVARLMASHPDGVTVAAVRDALGASRKHVLPLLAHLDATGVTRRGGDVRIAGPRMPAPADGGQSGRG
jgi:selenocysteine-specific elongation factor